MALQPYPGFVGPSYTSQSKIAADDELVNWYPEKIESGTGPAAYVLYPTPGLFVAETESDSPGRGGIAIFGQGYFVAGSSLFQLGIGAIATGISNTGGNKPIRMVTNGAAGNQILIGSDSSTYSVDLTTHAITTVGSTETTVSIGFVNGYGLRLDTNRSEVSFSALEDFTTWDALDVFQRNDAPDKWQSLLVHHKEVWLFGLETSSVYYNGDDPDLPFQPISSVFIYAGTASPYSPCVVGGSPMWVGQGADGTNIVYRANGYTPERVSTHATEYAMRSLDSRFVEGSTYQENGHTFYVLTFPAIAGVVDGATWVYDLTSGLWHRRGDWNGLDYDQLDTRGHLQLNGVHYTQSRSSGKVYLQSTALSVGPDGVTGIRRMRRAPHLVQAQQRIRIPHFRLHMETGVGVQSGQGSDPQVMLRWSGDGGQTFGSEVLASTGPVGAYGTLVDWWQLGQARDWVLEVSTSDPIPRSIVGAYVDFSVGAS